MTENLKPHPWSPHDTICIPEHAALHGGNPNVPAEMLSRGTLILGETGAGKSLSGVIPVLRGILKHGHEKSQCAALVIDPKFELLDVVRKEAGDRMIVVGGGTGPRVDFFEDTRGNISVKDALTKAIRCLSREGEAIVSARGDNAYWNSAGFNLVLALTELIGAIEAKGMSLIEMVKISEYWPCSSKEKASSHDVERFLRIAKHVRSHWEPNPGETDKLFASRIRVYLLTIQQNASAHLKKERIPRRSSQHTDVMHALRLMSRYARRHFGGEECIGFLECWSRRICDSADDIATALWRANNPVTMSPMQMRLIAALERMGEKARASWFEPVNILLAQFLTALDGIKSDASSSDFRNLGAALIAIAEDLGRYDIANALAWTHSCADSRTAFWYTSIAEQIIAPLVDRSLADRLWLDPISPCPDGFSVRGAMNEGKVIVYQPGTSDAESDNNFGKTLKGLWFRATFKRAARHRAVAYIADEFHRFFSGDTESSESNYLDRCRAFRGMAILATQSIASLRLKLLSADKSVSNAQADAALDVLLANCGNKFWFRSTDPGTISYLRRAIPQAGGQHVIDIRPPTTLNVGECYHLLADGTVGRRQIKLAEPQAPRRAA